MSRFEGFLHKWWSIILLTIISIVLGCGSQWGWCGLVFTFSIFVFISIWLWDEISESSTNYDYLSFDRPINGDTTKVAWFLSFFLVILSYIVIFIYGNNLLTDQCSYNYLLSSINQSLATLFALIFALMFTITQLGSKKRNLDEYFTIVVLIYILLHYLYSVPFVYHGNKKSYSCQNIIVRSMP